MKPESCVIVVLRKEEVVATYDAATQKAGHMVTIRLGPEVKTFKTTERKPALRAAMEAVILAHKGYNPQTDRVTIQEVVSSEGF